ncbi:hypothetical protein L3X38_037369 [Prunus dulcis]|uniref:Uncharacterized protein n=1 Tax=Prunus dulcis TaxID=3755 RepID=A0AAD4YPG4_PRUDU|nr:hypothetical protein L3X38_037369 [Prunus dulcis]
MVYRPSVFLAQEDCILLDTESLADDAFEFLVCMRSALLPVRLGGDLWLEPYCPNRFARQFGFDQGVPENKLLFSVCERQRCGIEMLARAQAVLLRKDTTARFYILRSTRIGECSWWVNHVMHQSQRINRDSHHKRARHANHNKVEDGSSSHVLDEESSNLVQGEMRFDDIPFPREMEPINVDNPTFEVISSGEEENIHHESANSSMGGSGSDFLAEVSEFQQIFGNGVNQNRREFISREIEGIFSRLYASETPAQLHMHHSEITKALRLLGSTVDILGCGETTFKQFAQLVDWIFELARRHSKSSAYIEAVGDVNIDVIHDLIRQHEECLNTKLALEAELTEVAKEIEDLDVKEVTIREAEERVRQMQEEHEAKKTSLNMQKMNFEISLEHQNEKAIQLQQSRIDAKEDLLPQIGSTRLSMKAQEQEIHRLINALFSSCSEL